MPSQSAQLVPCVPHRRADQREAVAVSHAHHVTLHFKIARVELFVVARQALAFWIVHDIDEMICGYTAGHGQHILPVLGQDSIVVIKGAVKDAK